MKPGAPDPHAAAAIHLAAARRLLAASAGRARTLADSPSPLARMGAYRARRRAERLRGKLGKVAAELRTLGQDLAAAQEQHDSYQRTGG